MFKVGPRQRERRLLMLVPCVMVAVALLVASPAPGAQGAPAGGPSVRLLADTDPAVVSLAREQRISVRAAQARLAWQEASGRLSGQLRRDLGDRFGGVWIDQAGGGRVKVATSAPGAAARARAVAARLGMGQVIDLVTVRHSYRYLYAASDTLGAEVVRANAGAPAPLVTGLATDRNAVVLTLPQGRALTRAQQRFVANARQAYGSAVVLERSATAYKGHQQACHLQSGYGLACDKPLRGGPAIDNGVTLCSAGFITRSKSDSKPYLLTAGHCGGGTWSTHFFDGSSHVIGNTWRTPRGRRRG